MIRYLYRKNQKLKRPNKDGDTTSDPQRLPQENLCEHQHAKLAALKSESGNQAPAMLKSEAPTQEKRREEACEECKDERIRRRKYRWKLIIALFPPAFLAAMDTTVVATALTTISSHFGIFLLTTLHVSR